MPLDIIQGDIAQVKADAIVNSANPQPVVGRGVDSAVHAAAGPSLLEERERVGAIPVGGAVATSAGRLPAKIVVHTVGPVWRGGSAGEFEALASCYACSLSIAIEHGCASIAFPLISTGAYAFPKDRALSVAKETIASFLADHDMRVILVVHDRAAFQLSREVLEGIEGYLGSALGRGKTASGWGTGAVPEPGAFEAADADLFVSSQLDAKADVEFSVPPQSLEALLERAQETFSERLLSLIDERHMTDPQVYKRANIDRRLFSKIRGKASYQPKKGTALALAVALRLDLNDTLDLIGRAGYTLSQSNVGDLIVRWFIESGNWDVNEINLALFEYGQPLIGS